MVCVALLVSGSAIAIATVLRSPERIEILVSRPIESRGPLDMLEVTLKEGQQLSVRAEARWSIGMTVTSRLEGDCIKLLRHNEVPNPTGGHVGEDRSDFVAIAPGRSMVYVEYTFRGVRWGITEIMLSVAPSR